jgi:hypothetical protein
LFFVARLVIVVTLLLCAGPIPSQRHAFAPSTQPLTLTAQVSARASAQSAPNRQTRSLATLALRTPPPPPPPLPSNYHHRSETRFFQARGSGVERLGASPAAPDLLARVHRIWSEGVGKQRFVSSRRVGETRISRGRVSFDPLAIHSLSPSRRNRQARTAPPGRSERLPACKEPLSLFLSLSVLLCLSLSLCPSVPLFVSVSVSLALCPLFLSISHSLSYSHPLSLFLSLFVSLFSLLSSLFSVSVCLSVCLSLSFSYLIRNFPLERRPSRPAVNALSCKRKHGRPIPRARAA